MRKHRGTKKRPSTRLRRYFTAAAMATGCLFYASVTEEQTHPASPATLADLDPQTLNTVYKAIYAPTSRAWRMQNAAGSCAQNKRRAEGRSLTDKEKGLLRIIFNDEIDVAHIRLHPHPVIEDDKETVAFVYLGDTCNIYLVAENLRQERDLSYHEDTAAVLIHEATHLWQSGGGPSSGRCKIYKYKTTSDNALSDFCNEQQAMIVGDYARLFLLPYQETGFASGLNIPVKKHEDIRRMVEDVFPWVIPARIRIGQENAIFRACRKRAHASSDLARKATRLSGCANTLEKTVQGIYLSATLSSS